MSSKGKAVATGKGKGKWTGDDDNTGGGRKRRNREVRQFFEDTAEEEDYDSSEDSDSREDSDLNFDCDDNIELKVKKEPPRAQNVSFSPREQDDNPKHPLTYRVRRYQVSRRIKLPTEVYDGIKCPVTHLTRVKNYYAMFQKWSDEALCQIFMLTLSGIAITWFEGLPSGSINSFAQLEEKFRSRFSICIPLKKSPAALFDIRRKTGESLKTYLDRFNMEMDTTPDVTVDFAVVALKRNCGYDKLENTLLVDPPQTLDLLRIKAHNYAKLEEVDYQRRIQIFQWANAAAEDSTDSGAGTPAALRRKSGESLKTYLDRFNMEMVTMDFTVDFAVEALKRNCGYDKLEDRLIVDPPQTLDLLRIKAHNYAKLEELDYQRSIQNFQWANAAAKNSTDSGAGRKRQRMHLT